MYTTQLLDVWEKLEKFDMTFLYKGDKALYKKYDVKNYTVVLQLEPSGSYFNSMSIDFEFKDVHHYMQVIMKYDEITLSFIGSCITFSKTDYEYKEITRIIEKFLYRNIGKYNYDELSKTVPIYSIVSLKQE